MATAVGEKGRGTLYSQGLAATNEDRLRYRRLCTRGEGVCQAALATVLTILVEGHENTSTTLGGRAFTTEAFDLAVRLDLVVLQDSHLDLLTLVLNLLGGLRTGPCQKSC